QPERECRRLLAHFGVERSAAQIHHAVANQSFRAAKKRFMEQGDEKRADFLREGRAGAWWNELSPAQRQFCSERFGKMLSTLGYPAADGQVSPVQLGVDPSGVEQPVDLRELTGAA